LKLALIAHDGKKAEMVAFMRDHMERFRRDDIELVATGTTGSHVEGAGLRVTKVRSGPYGGDAEIASQVARGEVDAVFFFRDPLDKHPHEPDILMLMRICDVHNVPLATNPASAKLIFHALVQSPI
jgi:methylglyoxal synthase